MRRHAYALLFFCVTAKADHRGTQFIGFTSFEQFHIETNASGVTLRSPELRPEVNWNELVPSWNLAGTNGLSIEAKVTFPHHETKWYSFGHWAADGTGLPRESVRHQQDADGDVLTDTLRLKEPGGSVQLRIILPAAKSIDGLKLLAFSFCDTTTPAASLDSPNGHSVNPLPVPERSQASYPDGINSWCSPTAVSMVLAYWSERLRRPELDHSVPDVARCVNDPLWPGTGNWAFNMAFAGAHERVRAYTTRFSEVSEIEMWVARGVPVPLSVSYSALRGEPKPDSGHLVVCIGFTDSGDVVVNDPGRAQVRQVYTRANLIKAWHHSENTVYLIYPESHSTPADPFGHWLGPKP